MRMRMKEMGEMGRGMVGERKSIGNFCMRVGIFVSMYFKSFLKQKTPPFNKVPRFFLTSKYFLDISPTPSTPKTPSISSLHPAHHSATKLSNGSTPPKPLFYCMVSHVYTSNGINTMEMSKKLYKDSVGMWSRIWIIWKVISKNKRKKRKKRGVDDLLWEEKNHQQRIL